MWINWIMLSFLGLASGLAISAGLFAFLIGLGVISDFADRTHTGKYVTLYEDFIVAGGILGNLFWIYRVDFLRGSWLLLGFGLLSGIFVGCLIFFQSSSAGRRLQRDFRGLLQVWHLEKAWVPCCIFIWDGKWAGNRKWGINETSGERRIHETE